MLNHSDWFALSDSVEEELTGQVLVAVCQSPDKLAVVEVLRVDYGLAGPLDSFESTELELSLMFRRPGRSHDVLIDRETGDLTVRTDRMSGRLQINRSAEADSSTSPPSHSGDPPVPAPPPPIHMLLVLARRGAGHQDQPPQPASV